MKVLYIYSIITAFVVLNGCSASKKAFNKAKDYEGAGLYVEAAEQGLKALREKPDFKEALVHLKKVAPKAYEELLNRAENLEAVENWDQAVREYERLDSLLRKMHRHGVVLETVNVRERLKDARQKAAAYHYANAEAFFENRSWQKAARAYLKAHGYIDNYNQSFERAIQSFFNLGDERLKNRKYSRALEAYHQVLKIAPEHGKAKAKIAEGHYRRGKQYFKEGRFRESLKQFETVDKYLSGYKDAADWADRAYEEAVQYVGVLPFENETMLEVNGYLIAFEILTRAIDANLKFADFLPYAEMVGLLHDYKIGRYRGFNEAQLMQIAREEGLKSFVWGRVRDILIKDRPASFVEYEHEKTVVVKDSLGNEIEETEPIFFREYTKSRSVRVVIQYAIIDTKTGKYLDRQRFVDEINDEARWTAYQGSIYDLPREKRRLLDAPRDPRPAGVLVNELLASISARISREVIRFYK